MGFGVPIDSWLRGPLRDWADICSIRPGSSATGYFDPEPIRRELAASTSSGQRNWHYPLWNVLMFQAWLERGDGE